MHDRAKALIAQLELRPHPEGGYFREIFRSPRKVRAESEGTVRSALTVIYFLLPAGEFSRWHRVGSDETWHFIEGDALELFRLDPGTFRLERMVLGPFSEGASPAATIPAGAPQAARSLGAYTLVTCAVAPGFEFGDFTLLRDQPSEADRLRALHPARTDLL